jgi:L-seryl-tRNA(Ser) seleniumtransferase
VNASDSDNANLAGLRELPAVDHLLKQPAVANLLDEFPRSELLCAVRGVLDELRAALKSGEARGVDVPSLALDIRQKLHERARPSLRRVINATGVVLHTGLGRAPLAEEAIEAVADVAAGYSNLELDLRTGQRGDRHGHVRELLREAVVSRGQLVEIGGSYRMPDIMAASGCRMVEVGTTNRTHPRDYERAITADTAVLLHVHTSNYRIQGFVSSPSVADLAALVAKRPAPFRPLVVDDLGSGLLDKRIPWPAGEDSQDAAPDPEHWDEPSVRESVEAGADLTLFSGDKLLGGPQAGVIVGRAALIERLQKNALTRTFRPDKMTLAGLEATLRLYRDPDALVRKLPIYRMLSASPESLRETADQLAQSLAGLMPNATMSCAADTSYAGGGSLPTLPFPTWVLRFRDPRLSSGQLAHALRRRDLPIICRVQDDALVFDCRTLRGDDDEQIAAALAEVLREAGG